MARLVKTYGKKKHHQTLYFAPLGPVSLGGGRDGGVLHEQVLAAAGAPPLPRPAHVPGRRVPLRMDSSSSSSEGEEEEEEVSSVCGDQENRAPESGSSVKRSAVVAAPCAPEPVEPPPARSPVVHAEPTEDAAQLVPAVQPPPPDHPEPEPDLSDALLLLSLGASDAGPQEEAEEQATGPAAVFPFDRLEGACALTITSKCGEASYSDVYLGTRPGSTPSPHPVAVKVIPVGWGEEQLTYAQSVVETCSTSSVSCLVDMGLAFISLLE
jgi:hypothetical protein